MQVSSFQAFLTETFSPNAEALFDQATGQDDLWATEFCLLECANVLWKEVRFNNLPPDRAEEMITLLMQLSIR